MSSSTYYQYRDVKVLIAHRLFKLDGWTVYGYHGDNSDPMTDYYDPAHWGGIAEKNGYRLVVDHSSAAEERRYRIRTSEKVYRDAKTREKIAKLGELTQERGATEAEEAAAKKAISAAKKGAVETDSRIHIAKDFRGKVVSIWYDFGDRLPMVDAAYLVDMLEALPVCSAFCSSRSSFARVYFVYGEDDGLLMPVRKTKEYGLAPAVLESAEQATTAAAETPLETNEKPAPVTAVAETYTDTTTAAEAPERDTERATSGIANVAMYILDVSAVFCLPRLLRGRQIGRKPQKPKKERTTLEGQEATHKPPLCSASRLAPRNAIHGHDSASGEDTCHKRKSRAIATTAPPIGYRFASTGKTIACKSKAPPGRSARPRRTIFALPRPAPE